jgi:hypothetical protein
MDAANLLSGLLGALLGVASALVIYLADRNRRVRAAVRVVFSEAITNEIYLKTLAEDGIVMGPISDGLYWAHMPALAARLSRDDLTTIGAAYMFVPYCERLRQEFLGGKALGPVDRNTLASTHNSFIEATVILRNDAYGRSTVKGP